MLPNLSVLWVAFFILLLGVINPEGRARLIHRYAAQLGRGEARQ